jgi:hypothetical protein
MIFAKKIPVIFEQTGPYCEVLLFKIDFSVRYTGFTDLDTELCDMCSLIGISVYDSK